MGSITFKKTKKNPATYFARVRRKNGTFSKTFLSRREAREWILDTEGALRRGVLNGKRMSMQELLEKYEKEVFPYKAPNSKRTQTCFLNWWKEEIGHLKICEVTPRVVSTKKHALKERGLANATISGYLSLLTHVFTIASEEWEVCERNPARSVKKPKLENSRVRFLSKEETERLICACQKSNNPHLFPAVALALLTGMRKREILDLRWKDINFEEELLIVRDKKTKSNKTLKLTNNIKKILLTLKNKSDYVFKREKGKQIHLYFHFQVAVKEANIHNFKFHDLRHTAATNLFRKCGNLKIVSEFLGHKSIASTTRYAHLHKTDVLRAMEEMEPPF